MLLISQVVGDGTLTEFPGVGPCRSSADIRVSVDGVPTGRWTLSPLGDFIIFDVPPSSGSLVEIERYTTTEAFAEFFGGGLLTIKDLSASRLHTVRVAEEARNYLNGAVIFSPALDAYNGRREVISRVGLAVDDTDVATLRLITAYLAGVHFPIPTPAEIAAALTTIQGVYAQVSTDADEVTAVVAHIESVMEAFATLLANLAALALSPNPHGADLIARIDGSLGQIVWRELDMTPTTRVFDDSGTWTKPTLTAYRLALVECWGGGAAGEPFHSTSSL